MLNFHGMPHRDSTAHVQDEKDGRHIEKRIVHVIPMTEVIETPVSCPPFLENAPPIRTQLVKVAFADGSTRLGCVTL